METTAQTDQTPRIETRDERPTVGISISVPFSEWGRAVALIGEVQAWLDARGVGDYGPPYFRYLAGEGLDDTFDLEIGWLVAEPVEGDERVVAGAVPAGRYAVLEHYGHPDSLFGSVMALDSWVTAQGLQLATHAGERRPHWTGRYEFYLTDPETQPDQSQWVTELASLLAATN
jgi:effector-binding domain-containing protein